MKLVIFDLDQTLVNLISIHDQATRRLFQEVFGVDARLTDIDFAGRSLMDNFAELAKLKGIPDSQFKTHAGKLLSRYETIFQALVPTDASKSLLPGAIKLLEELNRQDHFLVLYTGDSLGIVQTVFKATGIGPYFRLAVCGNEAPTRAGLIRLAVERAQLASGQRFEGQDVVVTGDSIRDVEAGKEVGALTIAVATGFHTEEQLKSAGPDFFFKTLEDTADVLRALNEAG